MFLRHLEYFSGIVFLTTNRIHVFDAAMKSRIHLALRYSPPELEMRQQIWTQSLEALPSAERDMDVDDVVDGFVKEKLHGREITNAVTAARTLARYEGQPLRPAHVEMALEVKNDFDANLRRMRTLSMVNEPRQHSLEALARRGSLLDTMSEEPEELGL